MGSTEMETTSTPTDQVEAQPVEAYLPPPAPSRGALDSWTPARIPGGRRLWTAALAAALLVSAGGIGLLYLDDSNNQATIRALNSKNQSLTGRTQILQDQLTVTQGKLTASQAQVDSLSTELKHPTLGVWNVPMTIHNSSEFLSATVPDTFTYHLKLKSSGPMSVSILSTSQFKDAILCVNNRIGVTNYCMHHVGAAYGALNVTSVDYDFSLGTGCAAYLTVITAASQVTITPDVSVTYNPAAAPTGSCA
ncbi:MAG TPA: hypothetical protein VGR34_01860 [Candidatus Dormibacteraeota bacterium]|nr:hypothetical protein [Candidatus Dormibacteraeota bacterium]